MNVADSDSVKNLVKETISHFGTVDILINNAGITMDSQLIKMTESQFDKVIDVNLKGVFNCTKEVAPYLIEKGYGKIISTSSVVALYGNFGQTNYVASKSAVIGMTKTWAKELGRKGVNVNAVAPGFIKTPMTEKVPQKVLELMGSKVPLGKLGEPEDIAKAYLFLASDDSKYINGVVLSVDGGMTN